MQTFTIELEQDQVLCHEGNVESDLLVLLSGSLLVCLRKGTQVTKVAELGPGEFIGELSFFDNRPRSADIIALTPCKLLKIPAVELRQDFPDWLRTLGLDLCRKIRQHDNFIRSKRLTKTKMETINVLSIDEQRHYHQILSK